MATTPTYFDSSISVSLAEDTNVQKQAQEYVSSLSLPTASIHVITAIPMLTDAFIAGKASEQAFIYDLKKLFSDTVQELTDERDRYKKCLLDTEKTIGIYSYVLESFPVAQKLFDTWQAQNDKNEKIILLQKELECSQSQPLTDAQFTLIGKGLTDPSLSDEQKQLFVTESNDYMNRRKTWEQLSTDTRIFIQSNIFPVLSGEGASIMND